MSPDDNQSIHEQAASDYCLRLAQQIKAYPRRRTHREPPPEELIEGDRAAHERAARIAADEEARTNSVLKESLEDLWTEETGAAKISDANVKQIEETLHSKPRLQASMASMVEYPPSEWLLEQELAARGDWPPMEKFRAADVSESAARVEWPTIILVRNELIAAGRWKAEDGNPDVYLVAEHLQRVGLCLSGGGIRSATFNLGVLQGLANLGKLGKLDYLSTVSGGGYIHQFFAAWLSRDGLVSVQKDLEPMPGPPSTRAFWPEPLRWLRRYSNYLTPEVGLFTADTWVAISIWLRNTFLNQLVLIATLLFVLALPHWRLSHASWLAAFLLTHGGCAGLFIFACFLLAAGVIFSQIGRPRPPCEAQTEANAHEDTSPAESSSGLGQGSILAFVLGPIVLASFAVSPYLYRSAFWQGDAVSTSNACQVMLMKDLYAKGAPVSTQRGLVLLHELHAYSRRNPDKPCALKPEKYRREWMLRVGGIEDFRGWRSAYSFHWWSPSERLQWDPSTSLVFVWLLVGIGLIVYAVVRALPNDWRMLILLLAVPGAMASAYAMIGLARFVLFAVSFFLPVEMVTRVNIAILPPMVIGIVFLSIELGGGLIGILVDESVREWFGRLRAWSFLFCIVWFSWTAAALLGPRLVDDLLYAAHGYLKISVIGGWIATTIASVMAGKSSFTSGSSSDNRSGLSYALNLVALIGPPVFVVGLALALSDVAERILDAMRVPFGALHLHGRSIPEFYWMLAILAFIAVLFSWRIDINEFSLHAFYRDRLARCYAGASNMDRKPNLFTGFAASDKKLRLVDLLPHAYRETPDNLRRQDCRGNAQAPTYQGPFPIFCTTINLSFGEDMAYQERKGAAFAFTPLYCGYDVGWTETDTDRVQFNGFTPTRDFAYDDGGTHMATAVAASGAAISPNWGYHSSPTMAFLLTIFNVRLGLWIRNPRHKRFRLRSKDANPSSPAFGLFYLLGELFGMVNDEASFVYLTDGGHFENMGLYELVRRHVMKIVICDAEQDGKFTFEGIGMAIRKCRIDFGAEIDLDISQLVPAVGTTLGVTHSVPGTIRYPSGAIGGVLYIKTAMTPGLPGDIVNYHKEHPAFPNDSTLNQWFTESQFESYRRLGQESAATGLAQLWLSGL